METIKIRTRQFNIEKGDYILFNGVCYLFCAGNRILYREGYSSYRQIVIPMTTVKKLALDTMQKVENNGMTKWYF